VYGTETGRAEGTPIGDVEVQVRVSGRVELESLSRGVQELLAAQSVETLIGWLREGKQALDAVGGSIPGYARPEDAVTDLQTAAERLRADAALQPSDESEEAVVAEALLEDLQNLHSAVESLATTSFAYHAPVLIDGLSQYNAAQLTQSIEPDLRKALDGEWAVLLAAKDLGAAIETLVASGGPAGTEPVTLTASQVGQAEEQLWAAYGQLGSVVAADDGRDGSAEAAEWLGLPWSVPADAAPATGSVPEADPVTDYANALTGYVQELVATGCFDALADVLRSKQEAFGAIGGTLSRYADVDDTVDRIQEGAARLVQHVAADRDPNQESWYTGNLLVHLKNLHISVDSSVARRSIAHNASWLVDGLTRLNAAQLMARIGPALTHAFDREWQALTAARDISRYIESLFNMPAPDGVDLDRSRPQPTELEEAERQLRDAWEDLGEVEPGQGGRDLSRQAAEWLELPIDGLVDNPGRRAAPGASARAGEKRAASSTPARGTGQKRAAAPGQKRAAPGAQKRAAQGGQKRAAQKRAGPSGQGRRRGNPGNR
jgi:hypothetical protein